jgi:hypothetical protein
MILALLLAVAAPANTQATPPERSPAWADIRDFGATGNDQSDDTEAIERALASGRPAYVPPGTFSISGLHMPQKGTLFGDGRASILRARGPGAAIIVTGGATGMYAVTIRQVEIVGPGAGSTGILLEHAHESTIESVDVHDFEIGVQGIRAWTNAIRHSRIYNNRKHNVVLGAECNDFTIETSQLDGAGEYGLFAAGNSSAIRLLNSVVQNCGRAAVRVEKGRAVSIIGTYFERNNLAAPQPGCDIEAVGALGVNVSGGVFYSARSRGAICLDATDGAAIIGTVVTDSGTPNAAIVASGGTRGVFSAGNFFRKPVVDPDGAVSGTDTGRR